MVIEAANQRTPTSDYNELKCQMARRDILRDIAAAAMADRMMLLVLRLVEARVLPPGTEALCDSILHPRDA